MRALSRHKDAVSLVLLLGVGVLVPVLLASGGSDPEGGSDPQDAPRVELEEHLADRVVCHADEDVGWYIAEALPQPDQEHRRPTPHTALDEFVLRDFPHLTPDSFSVDASTQAGVTFAYPSAESPRLLILIEPRGQDWIVTQFAACSEVLEGAP